MKLFIAGDTHGSFNEITRIFQLADNKGADAIVQVGDFGYWGYSADAQDFIQSVSRRAERTGIPFYWVDGNHEAHTQLRETYGPGGPEHNPTPEGFWQMLPGLFYIPRGTRWVWDGVTFMGVGGAVSVDKVYRLAVENGTTAPEWGLTVAKKPKGSRTLWWPEEAITDEEVEHAKSQGEVDVLFTHDTVTCANFGQRLKPDLDSQINRQRIDEIVRSAKPSIMFHGHYHTLMQSEFRHEDGSYTDIWGVAHDGSRKNTILFDTDLYFANEPEPVV